MFKKATLFLLTLLASLLAIAASAGVGAACTAGLYQPEPPKELLKR